MEGGKKTLSDVAAHLRENAGKAANDEELRRMIAKTIEDMVTTEKTLYSSEKEEFTLWQKQRLKWIKIWKAFSVEIPPLITEVKAVVSSLNDDPDFKHAPPEVQERLQNRKEGLEIICRMLDRLPQRQARMDVNDKMEIPRLKKLNVKGLEARFKTLEDCHDIFVEIDKLLEKICPAEAKVRDLNYNFVREARLDADRLKRTVTGFLKDHLLPAADGLERGIWDEEKLLAPLLPYESERDLTGRWFGAYHQCDCLLKKFMKKIGLAQVRAGREMEFDPESHTALGAETDSDLQNGQILELLRSGWRFHEYTIRPAEVLVVRN